MTAGGHAHDAFVKCPCAGNVGIGEVLGERFIRHAAGQLRTGQDVAGPRPEYDACPFARVEQWLGAKSITDQVQLRAVEPGERKDAIDVLECCPGRDTAALKATR